MDNPEVDANPQQAQTIRPPSQGIILVGNLEDLVTGGLAIIDDLYHQVAPKKVVQRLDPTHAISDAEVIAIAGKSHLNRTYFPQQFDRLTRRSHAKPEMFLTAGLLIRRRSCFKKPVFHYDLGSKNHG